MAACSISKRFNHNQYISLSTRCNRFKVRVGASEGTAVHVKFFYSYDVENEHPHWKELANGDAVSTVNDGVAEFFILYGPPPPDTVLPRNMANIAFPRADPSLKVPIVPHVSYTIRMGDRTWIDSGRIKPRATWGEVIFDEGVELAKQLTIPGSAGFVDTRRLFDTLDRTWMQLFEHIDVFDAKDEVKLTAVPAFNEQVLLRMMRVAFPDTDPPRVLPDLTSWGLLCGKSATEGGSIMRVFHTLADLVGRSKLVRRMYAGGKIALAGSPDTIEFKLDEANKLSHVFFFRLARSVVHEPALVLQLYEKEENGQWKAIIPTPYVTASQLDNSRGDPLRAFRSLRDSAHLPVLSQLTYANMLNTSWQSISSLLLTDPTDFAYSEAENYTELKWWESRFLLDSHK